MGGLVSGCDHAAMGREKIGPIQTLRRIMGLFQKPKWKFSLIFGLGLSIFVSGLSKTWAR